jgi:hypothetical protein
VARAPGVDPFDEVGEVVVGGPGPQRSARCLVLDSTRVGQRREQQVLAWWLELLEDLDRPRGWGTHDPGRGRTGRVRFAFEGEAAQVPSVGLSRTVAQDTQTATT